MQGAAGGRTVGAGDGMPRPWGGASRRQLARAVALVGIGVVASVSGPVTTASAVVTTPIIHVLSSPRADLVTGGEALVAIDVPAGAELRKVGVVLNGSSVKKQFALRSDGRFEGLLTNLRNGANTLKVSLPDGTRQWLTITNYPKGGPVFAGPQVQPWLCTTEVHGLGLPSDEQCDAPTQISYEYQPTGSKPGEYKPYEPNNPPSDVAMTTTDSGETVPYIIRVERGTIDRSIYEILVLADPSRPWTPTAPQKTWNDKLFVAFGGGAGTLHVQMTQEPWVNVGSESGLDRGEASEGQISQPELLSRGWMAAATGMNTYDYDANEVVSAEALMILKEHIVDAYGPIRRTISVGNSGGSVQQVNIAASYPGLLDGIVPAQTFPDAWSLFGDATDCSLLRHYFTTISPELWPELSQQLAVGGKTAPIACAELGGLAGDWFDPQNRGPEHAGASARFGCGLPPNETFNPVTNPTGVRCSVQDYQNAIWGHSGPFNAAPLPWDNTGVQYGLSALQKGMITPEQFVDLNTKIGGIDNDGDFTAQSTAMDTTTATTMFRAGRTTDARQLANVPIIDIRQSEDSKSDMHQPYFSQVLRDRLDAANGTHANEVFWNMPPHNMDIEGVFAIDRWLEAVEADHSDLSRAEKIIRDKPGDLLDTCWIEGSPVTDSSTCNQKYGWNANARIVAGEPFTDDVRKCQLKPLRREDYNVMFTDAQWEQLQADFPTGVCDWTLPSVGYQPSIPWMTYAGGPGGTPLGPAPQSTTSPPRK